MANFAGSILVIVINPSTTISGENLVEASTQLGRWISLGILLVAFIFFSTECLSIPLISGRISRKIWALGNLLLDL